MILFEEILVFWPGYLGSNWRHWRSETMTEDALAHSWRHSSWRTNRYGSAEGLKIELIQIAQAFGYREILQALEQGFISLET